MYYMYDVENVLAGENGNVDEGNDGLRGNLCLP